MSKKMIVVFLLTHALGASAFACEISLPQAKNLPGQELVAPTGFAWVGSPALAAQVPENGHWIGMGSDHNYRDKWWWWREGYEAHLEANPGLSISAKKLDGEALSFTVPSATNAVLGPSEHQRYRILIMLEFPVAGCWEVNATYNGEKLQFVFLVGG